LCDREEFTPLGTPAACAVSAGDTDVSLSEIVFSVSGR
jgi:hypothetical protein